MVLKIVISSVHLKNPIEQIIPDSTKFTKHLIRHPEFPDDNRYVVIERFSDNGKNFWGVDVVSEEDFDSGNYTPESTTRLNERRGRAYIPICDDFNIEAFVE